MSKCRYCNSTSYGSCSSSPNKKHEHLDDEKHCEFCGSSSYGSCSSSPTKKHHHGSGATSADGVAQLQRAVAVPVRTANTKSSKGSQQSLYPLGVVREPSLDAPRAGALISLWISGASSTNKMGKVLLE